MKKKKRKKKELRAKRRKIKKRAEERAAKTRVIQARGARYVKEPAGGKRMGDKRPRLQDLVC